MDLDLGCAASYLVLLEERQFARAAVRLGLTPSALTKRIQRLERQVGVPLVVRGAADGVRPTVAGRVFARHARALLQTAETARTATRAASESRHPELVVGVPSGPLDFLGQLDLRAVVAAARRRCPGLRVRARRVAFQAITRSLVDADVDVLLTVAPVRHPAVVSTALPVSVNRIGLVGRDHELAGCDSADAETFSAYPMLHSQAVPSEWMSLFVLADVRPLREAHLLEASVEDAAAVSRHIRGDLVAIGPEMFANLSPSMHAVSLRGLKEMTFYAASRCGDRRTGTAALVDNLRRVPPKRLVVPASRSVSAICGDGEQ